LTSDRKHIMNKDFLFVAVSGPPSHHNLIQAASKCTDDLCPSTNASGTTGVFSPKAIQPPNKVTKKNPCCLCIAVLTFTISSYALISAIKSSKGQCPQIEVNKNDELFECSVCTFEPVQYNLKLQLRTYFWSSTSH
jgi:hypothetical protein